MKITSAAAAVVLITVQLSLFFGPIYVYGQNGTTCVGAGFSAGCCNFSAMNCRVSNFCYCDEVCRTVFDDCCSDVPQVLNCQGPIRPKLFQAIMTVESSGDINAVGDTGGASIGPFQIQEGYWNDSVVYDPTLAFNGQTYQNCTGAGSIEYSMKVMQAYMSRYATEARLGWEPTDEDIARIHNGGPSGYRKNSTLVYWERVQSHL